MNRRTFLKRVGATIAGLAAGLGLVKKAKAEKEPIELVVGIDPASGDDFCCLSLFKCNADGKMELVDIKYPILEHWPPDYGEISMIIKEKPSRIIYEDNSFFRYDDHELHAKAYNNYMAGDQWTDRIKKQLTQFNRKEKP